jgi:hypothetical protein
MMVVPCRRPSASAGVYFTVLHCATQGVDELLSCSPVWQMLNCYWVRCCQDFDAGLDTAFQSYAAQLDGLASGLPNSWRPPVWRFPDPGWMLTRPGPAWRARAIVHDHLVRTREAELSQKRRCLHQESCLNGSWEQEPRAATLCVASYFVAVLSQHRCTSRKLNLVLLTNHVWRSAKMVARRCCLVCRSQVSSRLPCRSAS